MHRILVRVITVNTQNKTSIKNRAREVLTYIVGVVAFYLLYGNVISVGVGILVITCMIDDYLNDTNDDTNGWGIVINIVCQILYWSAYHH